MNLFKNNLRALLLAASALSLAQAEDIVLLDTLYVREHGAEDSAIWCFYGWSDEKSRNYDCQVAQLVTAPSDGYLVSITADFASPVTLPASRPVYLAVFADIGKPATKPTSEFTAADMSDTVSADDRRALTSHRVQVQLPPGALPLKAGGNWIVMQPTDFTMAVYRKINIPVGVDNYIRDGPRYYDVRAYGDSWNPADQHGYGKGLCSMKIIFRPTAAMPPPP